MTGKVRTDSCISASSGQERLGKNSYQDDPEQTILSMSQNALTLCAVDTGYYADTVEWCPLKPFEDILACGTYQLLEGNNENEFENSDEGKRLYKRVGNIQLYRLEDSRLTELWRLETAGILDTKWFPHLVNQSAILGAVSSEGEVKIFRLALNGLGSSHDFVEQTCHQTDEEKICLSMDWSPASQWSHHVSVSDSGGRVTLLEFTEGSWELKQLLQWTGHQYEAWITAFDAWNPAVVYSGGDDCHLKGWDTRTNCQNAIFTSKRHSMGVSSIQCNPTHEYVMATGSYDENILIWDTRSIKKPLCSASPGGGVWRIKWHPDTGQFLLAPCMYEGFHILEYGNKNGDHGLELVTSYMQHTSIAYGADWCRREAGCPAKKGKVDDEGQRLLNKDCKEGTKEETELKQTNSDPKASHYVATCSFYDHLLHLWKVCL